MAGIPYALTALNLRTEYTIAIHFKQKDSILREIGFPYLGRAAHLEKIKPLTV